MCAWNSICYGLINIWKKKVEVWSNRLNPGSLIKLHPSSVKSTNLEAPFPLVCDILQMHVSLFLLKKICISCYKQTRSLLKYVNFIDSYQAVVLGCFQFVRSGQFLKMERSKARAYIFPATTLQISSRALPDRL